MNDPMLHHRVTVLLSLCACEGLETTADGVAALTGLGKKDAHSLLSDMAHWGWISGRSDNSDRPWRDRRYMASPMGRTLVALMERIARSRCADAIASTL